MPLKDMAYAMPILDVDALVESLPVDQAHMLRAVARQEDGVPLFPVPHTSNLYDAVMMVIDTDEWAEVMIWKTKKQRGKEVADEPPHDPRRELKALSKLRKADLLPFARRTSISTGMNKAEMLEQLRPFFKEYPIFHQMLFSLVNNRLLTIESRDVEEVEGLSLFVKMEGDLESVRRCLDARWESDHEILRGLLNNFLIRAFELEETLLGQAILDTDRRASVEELYSVDAVADRPIQVPGRVTTSAYHAILWILTSVELTEGERVLICGAKGCMIAALAKRVVGPEGEVRVLEWNEETAAWAKEAAGRHGFSEDELSVIHQDDVTEGTGEKGYWNAIIVNGSVPKIPYPLLEQLDDESGRLLFFISSPGERASKCWVIKKNEEVLDVKELSDFLFTPIVGKYGWDEMDALQKEYDRLRIERERRPEKDKIGRVIDKAPYPIAKALIMADTAADPSDQHSKALSLYELLIKFYAFIAIQAMDKDDCMRAGISEKLPQLYRKPSTGHWLPILREASKVSDDSRALNRLDGILQSKIQERNLIKCHQMLEIYCGKKNAGKKKSVRLIDFLTKVVNYRNQSSEGHGPPLGDTRKGENAELLRDAFVSLLRSDCIPPDWNLYFVRSNSTRAGGRILYDILYLKGSDFRRETKEVEGEALLPIGVYLDMDELESLTITPWLTLGEGHFGQPELFVFKQEGRYETYHNEDFYPADEEKRLLEDLMDRHPLTPKELENLESGRTVFKEMLGIFVSDGILERDEINNLVNIQRKFGLVSTDEEAEEQLIRIVKAEYPEVHVESADD